MAHLYRVRDGSGSLLYIGITECLEGRFMNGHQYTAHWWFEMADLTVTWYADMRAARAAESEAIATERPPWNLAGPPDYCTAALMRSQRPFEERLAHCYRVEKLIREARFA